MNEFLQFALLLVLTASVILQTCAAFFSIRLMRLSRYNWSWILISAALVLMAVRRAITFHHLLSAGINHSSDFYAETVAFVISLLMVAGLFSIAPLMRRLYSGPDLSEKAPFGELFEKITSGVVVYEATDNGRGFVIRGINPAAERIEKIAQQHVIGRQATEVFPGIEEFGLLDVLHRVWKTGRPEGLPLRYYQDDRISGWRDNFVYRRFTGEVVAVYNDVSVQMRMQEELERRERKFRLLFEHAPLPYQSLDNEGRILEVNPAWLHLTGLERTSAVGRLFSELLTRSGRPYFQECLTGLKNNGSVSDVALELRRHDGTLLNVEIDALSLCGKTGGIEQIYCMLRDKSGSEAEPDNEAAVENRARVLAVERLAEEHRELQRQRLSMLGELTAGMAHELNMPVMAARNAFNLMREDMSPASPHYEFVEIASLELARMADMIEQMYRFHEPVPQECEQININAMLDNALILVRPALKTHRIQLRDERTKELPVVRLPPGAVMLTLLNPIKNSIEAMSSDGVLTLRTGAAEQGGVFVEIEDNGPGIPIEFLPHLFEPFTTFRHTGGEQRSLGLGMTIVQHILDILGGSVTVHSNTGEGTRVRIVLPASFSDEGDVT
ncbi:MAG: ATP-binding protein [Kiritimatiellales bacterium]